MSAVNHGALYQSLLRRLKRAHGAPVAQHAVNPHAAEPLWQLVYSFLLWDSTTAKADQAMRRIASSVVDLNELRVCFPDEIAATLGERYPRVEERAMRLRAALNDLYIREHAVALDRLKAMSKRDARQYLESLDGAPSYVAARVFLLCLGGHAVPVSERILARLVAERIVESDATIEKAASLLERHTKASQAVEAHRLLQAWSEEAAPAPADGHRPGRSKPSPASRAGRKGAEGRIRGAATREASRG